MDTKTYAILILEIRRFLSRRSQDAVVLSRRDRQLLDSSIAFLSQVVEGQRLLTQHHRLVPNVLSLSAYSFASSALATSEYESAVKESAHQHELFQVALNVLQELRFGKALNEIHPAEVQQTHWLLDRLLEFAFEEAQADGWPPADELVALLTNSA